MREAVIVSTARTPIGKAYRGAFNDTQAQALGGHAIKHAVERAGVDPGEIEDVVIGAALQQGSTGTNIARQAALRAGLSVTVAGQSMDRQCASGLMAIATAAKRSIFISPPSLFLWLVRQSNRYVLTLPLPEAALSKEELQSNAPPPASMEIIRIPGC